MWKSKAILKKSQAIWIYQIWYTVTSGWQGLPKTMELILWKCRSAYSKTSNIKIQIQNQQEPWNNIRVRVMVKMDTVTQDLTVWKIQHMKQYDVDPWERQPEYKQKWNTGICSSLYNFELYEPNEASKIHNCVTIKLWRWNERESGWKRMMDSKHEKMSKEPSNSFQLTPAGWSYQWWPCYSSHITHICIHPKYSTYMLILHNMIKMHKAKTISFLNVHSVRALKSIMINHQNISLSQKTK